MDPSSYPLVCIHTPQFLLLSSHFLSCADDQSITKLEADINRLQEEVEKLEKEKGELEKEKDEYTGKLKEATTTDEQRPWLEAINVKENRITATINGINAKENQITELLKMQGSKLFFRESFQNSL